MPIDEQLTESLDSIVQSAVETATGERRTVDEIANDYGLGINALRDAVAVETAISLLEEEERRTGISRFGDAESRNRFAAEVFQTPQNDEQRERFEGYRQTLQDLVAMRAMRPDDIVEGAPDSDMEAEEEPVQERSFSYDTSRYDFTPGENVVIRRFENIDGLLPDIQIVYLNLVMALEETANANIRLSGNRTVHDMARYAIDALNLLTPENASLVNEYLQYLHAELTDSRPKKVGKKHTKRDIANRPDKRSTLVAPIGIEFTYHMPSKKKGKSKKFSWGLDLASGVDGSSFTVTSNTAINVAAGTMTNNTAVNVVGSIGSGSTPPVSVGEDGRIYVRPTYASDRINDQTTSSDVPSDTPDEPSDSSNLSLSAELDRLIANLDSLERGSTETTSDTPELDRLMATLTSLERDGQNDETNIGTAITTIGTAIAHDHASGQICIASVPDGSAAMDYQHSEGNADDGTPLISGRDLPEGLPGITAPLRQSAGRTNRRSGAIRVSPPNQTPHQFDRTDPLDPQNDDSESYRARQEYQAFASGEYNSSDYNSPDIVAHNISDDWVPTENYRVPSNVSPEGDPAPSHRLYDPMPTMEGGEIMDMDRVSEAMSPQAEMPVPPPIDPYSISDLTARLRHVLKVEGLMEGYGTKVYKDGSGKNGDGIVEVCSPIFKNFASMDRWFRKADKLARKYRYLPWKKTDGGGGMHLNISLNMTVPNWQLAYTNFFIMIANYPEINWIFNEPSDNHTAKGLVMNDRFIESLHILKTKKNNVLDEEAWNNFSVCGGKGFGINCKDSDYHFEVRTFQMVRSAEELRDIVTFINALLSACMDIAKWNMLIPLEVEQPIKYCEAAEERGYRLPNSDQFIDGVYAEKMWTAESDFNELLRWLELDPAKYRKYIRRNFYARRGAPYGKKYMT